MNVQDGWEKALKSTEIIRPRVQSLSSFDVTKLPYIVLSESSFNLGDTVIRKGEVLVERPELILAPQLPQFEDFDLEQELQFNEDTLLNFFLVRGITFPALRYSNKGYSLDIHKGNLKQVVGYYRDRLQRKEDVHTGLIVGPGDCWQFCVLIFIYTQVVKSAENDIKNLLERLRRKGDLF